MATTLNMKVQVILHALSEEDLRYRAITGFVALLLALSLTASAGQKPRAAAAPYFPDRSDWQHRKADEVGMDAARLDEAVKFAIESENPATKDMALFLATTFGRNQPFDTPIRPV